LKILNSIISQIDPSIGGDLEIPKTATGDSSTVTTVLQYAFVLGAGISMLVIIIAGIQFMLSQGEPAKTTKARNAVIYAGVGLALCALSFTIVRFVLTKLL